MSKCYRHGGASCPDCMDEVVAELGEPADPTPTRQAEQAVLEAAEALVGYWGFVEAEDLKAAVRVLRRTRQPEAKPQPKLPSEVRPGTRFRFANPAIAQGEYTLLCDVQHGGRAFLGDDGITVCRFYETDRIIPIQEQ